MIRLPDPARGYKNTFDRNIRTTVLISGGAASAKALNTRQSFAYSWDYRSRADADVILGFYNDAWGGGPYTVLDPTVRNYLRLDSSLMGSRRGVLTGWVPSVGTAAYDPTVAGFQLPSGVARWVGAGNGSVFGEGQIVAGVVEALPGSSMPYTATEPYTVTVYAKTSTGTASVTPRLSGRNAANTLHTDVGSTPVTLTTAYQRLTLSASAGLFAGAQLAATANPWVAGTGTPRCSVVATADSTIQFYTSRGLTLTLQEI
jgi:hypothetical protein